MRERRSGFSLVELLVVIGIISILLAIIIPVYGRAKEKARQTDCASHLHAIVNAIRMYHDDWRAYPPPHAIDHLAGTPIYTSRRRSGAVITLYATGDLDDPAALICKDDPTDWKAITTADEPYEVANPLKYPAPVAYTSYNTWPNPDTDQLEQVYNWYGYDSTARGLETRAEAGAQYDGVTDRLGQLMWSGYVDAANPGTWTGRFKGLINRNAPDSTVITHCPWHRSQYRPTAQQDIVAFLSGKVELKPLAQFDWVRQEDK